MNRIVFTTVYDEILHLIETMPRDNFDFKIVRSRILKVSTEFKDKFLLFSSKHPKEAVNNSLEYFDLTDKEIDIIRTHMFPIDIKLPKYAESWLVSTVDKVVSTNEFRYKFMNKLSLLLNVTFR